MTRLAKRLFIKAIMESIRDEALMRVEHMPEDWNGMEIREYLADKLDRERHMSRGRDNRRTYRKRLRDYKNTVAVTSGL